MNLWACPTRPTFSLCAADSWVSNWRWFTLGSVEVELYTVCFPSVGSRGGSGYALGPHLEIKGEKV